MAGRRSWGALQPSMQPQTAAFGSPVPTAGMARGVHSAPVATTVCMTANVPSTLAATTGNCSRKRFCSRPAMSRPAGAGEGTGACPLAALPGFRREEIASWQQGLGNVWCRCQRRSSARLADCGGFGLALGLPRFRRQPGARTVFMRKRTLLDVKLSIDASHKLCEYQVRKLELTLAKKQCLEFSNFQRQLKRSQAWKRKSMFPSLL